MSDKPMPARRARTYRALAAAFAWLFAAFMVAGVWHPLFAWIDLGILAAVALGLLVTLTIAWISEGTA